MSIIRSAPADRGCGFTRHFFLCFSVNFLTFSPYEQQIFVNDKSCLCFLSLTDLSIHKQRKTRASCISATDSYGEKSLPALQLHFAPLQLRHVQTTYQSHSWSVLCLRATRSTNPRYWTKQVNNDSVNIHKDSSLSPHLNELTRSLKQSFTAIY